MDLENMSKEELFQILERFYAKVVKPIPNKKFIVGNYYRIEQAEDDVIELGGENLKTEDFWDHIAFLSFEEAHEYLGK